MNYNNVNLWFAKDDEDKIVTIEEVNKENGKIYHCPLCGSDLIPRQGDINSWHFAHEDKTKCDGESRIHWWVKNKLIEKGTKFTIEADETREYICKEIFIEQSHKVGNNVYKPDITVLTESGETIYFEMVYSNKKRLEDYLDLWIELGNIVVEVDTKTLVESTSKSCLIFKALYYNGKCFNIKKSDSYYDTIGQYKEKLIKKGEYLNKKADVERLDWFWKEIVKYSKDSIYDLEELFLIIDSIEEQEILDLIFKIIKKHKMIEREIMTAYHDHKKDIFDKFILEKVNKDLFQVTISDSGYNVETINKDCIYSTYWEVIKYYKNKTNNTIISEIEYSIKSIIEKYNKYVEIDILASEYNLRITYSNKLIHLPTGCYILIKDMNNIKDEIITFNKQIEDIYSFKEHVNLITEDILSNRNKKYTLSVYDINIIKLKIGKHDSLLILNGTDDESIKKRVELTISDRQTIIQAIKTYFFERLSEYQYKEQDIECYYNGYGNIVIRLYSSKYSNRCFRIKEDLMISSLDRLNGFIETTISKAKQENDMEKRKKRKELKHSIKCNLINQKTNMEHLNTYISNKYGIKLNVKYKSCDNMFILQYEDIKICDLLKVTDKYLEKNNKVNIYKRVKKEINKNINLLNPINSLSSILKILSKFENIYENIWIKNHEFTTDTIIAQSLDRIDFLLKDNDLTSIYAEIHNKFVMISKNKYTYDSIEELHDIINTKFSNYVRKIRYGG